MLYISMCTDRLSHPFFNISILNYVHLKIFQQCVCLLKNSNSIHIFILTNLYILHMLWFTWAHLNCRHGHVWCKRERKSRPMSPASSLYRVEYSWQTKAKKIEKFCWKAHTNWTVNSSKNGPQFQALVYSHKSESFLCKHTITQQPCMCWFIFRFTILNAVWLLITFNFHYFDEIIIKQSNFNTSTHTMHAEARGFNFWMRK